MLRLASLTTTGLGTVQYTYDTYGKLTKIARGTTEYNLTYDTWNRSLETKVGTTALSANTYDLYGRLDTVTYANGFSVRYVYDDLDRVKKIYQKDGNALEELTYEMIYNGDGDLYEIRNFRTGRSSFFAYDHAGRCMESLERSITCTYEIVYDVDNIPLYKEYTVTSYGTVISSYAYQYDVCNNLTKLTCSVAGSTWDTVYTYDADNRPLTTTLSSGKVITNTYDKLGRISKRSIGLNTAYETNLTYVAGYHTNETTSLVATYQNGSDAAYSYTYDDNGNITQIAQGTTTTTYTYDSANRLTRENNQVTNQTVTYEYDSWGNILNKKVYAYTTGALGTPTQTIPYSYTNTTWGDQLTSYNGSTIVYDSMGNPTTYRGYAMTWRGKQLTGASNGTDTLTFEYNEDGLRQSKTVNNTSTNYYYNGSVLIGMQKNTDVLRFSYDASGSVVSVNYNGTEYYYLRNAQGDIVKIIDGSGTTVVEYTYDTWGKKVQITGTLASSLGTLQPFRYRGYVYDEETGLYYLQSRYYDPEVCRFISADVLLSTGQGVLGHNCYAYCLDNPVMMADEYGSASKDISFTRLDGSNNSKYYKTMDEAAIAFAKQANLITAEYHVEVCAFIYAQSRYDEIRDEDYICYTLSEIYIGEHDNVIKHYLEHSFGAVGFAHSHPNCTRHCTGKDAKFSSGDCFTAFFTGVCYMSDTASGKLYKIYSNSVFKGFFVGVDVYTDKNNRVLNDKVILVQSGLPKAHDKYDCRYEEN